MATYVELLHKHAHDRKISQKSQGWFAGQVRQLTNKITPMQAMRAGVDQQSLVLKPRIGFMYLYGYDPKTKDTLRTLTDSPWYCPLPLPRTASWV